MSDDGNRVAVLRAPGEVVVEDRATPRPGPDEVLVRVAAVGVCGSDVHYYADGRIGDHVVDAPLVLGHEASGTVVAAGPGAGRHALGTRVAIEPGVPCGRCRECRTGRYNLCADVVFLATPPVDGAFARYLAVHEDFAHPLPDAVSDVAGGLLEPLSVGIGAARLGHVAAGQRVLITGAGPIGVIAAQVCAARGASAVVSDPVPARRALALRHGAAEVVDADAVGTDAGAIGEVDALLECSGHSAALRAGLELVRPAGRVVLVGMGADVVELPLPLVQAREITVVGSFRYANTYPEAIELVRRGLVDLDALVGARFTLADTQEALDTARHRPEVLKALVQPWSPTAAAAHRA